MANNTIVHGWQDQPNSRGTFDIVKTCVGTIVLLCWSSVCPNVPTLKKGLINKSFGKLQLFLLAMLGPDFIFMTALGQLNTAWNAKKALQNNGYRGWTLRHCFFTNMGGIHLEFRDRKDNALPTFPVDCGQLLYLAQQGYISLPYISEDDISDRNKTNGFTRTITFVQAVWFTINIFGRIAQGLFVTTLELTTLAFVFLMTCCSIFWWRKPMDVERPIIISVDADLSAVLIANNAPTISLGRTPLSFLNRQEWFVSQFWAYYIQALRNVLFSPSTIKPTEADHFESIDFFEVDLKWEMSFGLAVPAYSAIFMAAWNSSFPTAVERLLWRISAIICLAYCILGAPLAVGWQKRSAIASWIDATLHFLTMKKKPPTQETDMHGKSNTTPGNTKLTRLLYCIGQSCNWMRNLSPDKDPMLAVSVRLWLPTTTLCIMYCFSRAFILIEDALALRSLPQSAFQTVNWGQYSPIL